MRVLWISIFIVLFSNIVYPLQIKGSDNFVSYITALITLYDKADMSDIKPGLTGAMVLKRANIKGIYHKDYTSIDEKLYGRMPDNYCAFYWNGYIIFNDDKKGINDFIDTLFHEIGHAYYYGVYGKPSSEDYAKLFAIVSSVQINSILIDMNTPTDNSDIESYEDYDYEVH